MLHKYIDQFVLLYLDNIVVFFQTKEEHAEYIQKILQKLREVNLYVKLFNCMFNAKEIDFLRFKVSQFGISMMPSKVDLITT